MLLSSLVLELSQHSFVRDWPEIWKKIPLLGFFPISENLGKLGAPNLTQMCLMICYEILQNASVIGFTVSELLRESQQDGGVKLTPSPQPD